MHLMYFLWTLPVTCFAIAWHSDKLASMDQRGTCLVASMVFFCAMNALSSLNLIVDLDLHIKKLLISNAIAVVLSSLAVICFLTYCWPVGFLSSKLKWAIPAIVSTWILMAIVASRSYLLGRKNRQES